MPRAPKASRAKIELDLDTRIGVIGGTDMAKLTGVLRLRAAEVETPFGPAQINFGEGELADLIFVVRHGTENGLLPQQINYRANLKALEQQGVQRVIATFAVDSLFSELPPGDLVVMDQFLELAGEPITFHEIYRPENQPDLADPYCRSLSQILVERISEKGLSVRSTGTYGCLGGARRATAAEVRMLRTLEAHVVGMTAAPETILARELGLHYTAVGSITQWAAGVKGTAKSNPKALAGGPSRLLAAILETLRVSELGRCSCRS